MVDREGVEPSASCLQSIPAPRRTALKSLITSGLYPRVSDVVQTELVLLRLAGCVHQPGVLFQTFVRERFVFVFIEQRIVTSAHVAKSVRQPKIVQLIRAAVRARNDVVERDVLVVVRTLDLAAQRAAADHAVLSVARHQLRDTLPAPLLVKETADLRHF